MGLNHPRKRDQGKCKQLHYQLFASLWVLIGHFQVLTISRIKLDAHKLNEIKENQGFEILSFSQGNLNIVTCNLIDIWVVTIAFYHDRNSDF